MQNKLIQLAAGVALAASFSAAADNEFDINLSGDAVRGEFSFDVGMLPNNDADANVGLLYTDNDDNGDFTMLHGGLLVSGDAGATDAIVQAGLGVRAAGFEADGFSGAAIAIGGEVDARLPQLNRIGLGAHIYYAPDASSFSDVSEYFEIGANINYEIIRNGFIYLGYRNIGLDVDDVDVTADNGFNGGFRVRF